MTDTLLLKALKGFEPAHCIVVIDGELSEEHSSLVGPDKGFEIQHGPGEILLKIARNTVVSEPIGLVFLSTMCREEKQFFRCEIQLGERAELALFESHVNECGELANSTAVIALGAGSKLSHTLLMRGNASSACAQALQVSQARDSTYAQFFVQCGGESVNNDMQLDLQGQGASCLVEGLMLATHSDKAAFTSSIRHLSPHCQSTELVKGIFGDSAQGAFRGHVLVAKGADLTNAAQSNKNLLLSPKAQVQTRPELEIDADEVKCSHGSTVGQLDEAAVFYCMSRGIDEKNARMMLALGFADELLERLHLPILREALHAEIESFVRALVMA